MMDDFGRRVNWVGLPLVATLARLLCRELTRQNEYLPRVVGDQGQYRVRPTNWKYRACGAEFTPTPCGGLSLNTSHAPAAPV